MMVSNRVGATLVALRSPMKQGKGMVQGDRNGVFGVSDFSFDTGRHCNIIRLLKNRKEVEEPDKGN